MNTFLKRFLPAASAFFLCVVFQLSAAGHENSNEKTPPLAELPADSVMLNPVAEIPTINYVDILTEKNQIVQDTALPPCDIVFYKTGKLEYCKVIETSPTTISYKMCDYQDGPTIIVSKSDIHKVRYANGREDIIDVKPSGVKNAYTRGKKDVMATLSMIFGIATIGILFLVGYFIPMLAAAAIVLGVISLIRINRRRGELRGKGSAWIGIGLAALAIILLLALI